MPAPASPNFSRLLALLASTQLLLSPNQSGGRGDWLSHTPSPLSEVLLLSLQEAGCTHRKAQRRSENQPKPLPAVGFTFLRGRVISTAFEFLPGLGSKEKPVPTGPFFFSLLGHIRKGVLGRWRQVFPPGSLMEGKDIQSLVWGGSRVEEMCF